MEEAHHFHKGLHASHCPYGADDWYRHAEQDCLQSVAICQLSADTEESRRSDQGE
jgi:hypothetical protein